MKPYGSASTGQYTWNFWQSSFAYKPPVWYKTLSTANLPEPTIKNPKQYFDAKLYAGNGTTQSITGLGFQPDFVWIKSRSSADNHVLQSIWSNWTYLNSNTTSAEGTAQISPSSSGFFVSTGNAAWNASGGSYVAWNWKAGWTAVTNTAGSITSKVSANPTAGFSIVSYTGNGTSWTIGHGLGAIPKLIITKSRNNSYDWHSYHANIGIGNRISLNSSNWYTSAPEAWNNTLPTTTVFSVWSSLNTNQSSSYIIAYLWSEVPWFSKFWSYTWNGSNDWPFIYTWFKPRFILFKHVNTSSNWLLFDTERESYNGSFHKELYAQSASQEASYSSDYIDVLSNGFKLRNWAFEPNNPNWENVIYAAFAEQPFWGVGVAPATAR
jgi:hypothetical protein